MESRIKYLEKQVKELQEEKFILEKQAKTTITEFKELVNIISTKSLKSSTASNQKKRDEYEK